MKRQKYLGKRVLSFALCAALVAGSISVTSAAPAGNESEAPISGAYKGTPSKVIGLTSKVTTKTITSDVTGQKELRYNYALSTNDIAPRTDWIALPNAAAWYGDQFVDATSGLYTYGGVYYANIRVDKSHTRVQLYNPVKIVAQASEAAPIAAPEADPATNLYVVEGKYYQAMQSKNVDYETAAYYGPDGTKKDGYDDTYVYKYTKGTWYVSLSNEVVVLSTVSGTAAKKEGKTTNYSSSYDWTTAEDAAKETFFATQKREVTKTDPETGKNTYNYLWYSGADGTMYEGVSANSIRQKVEGKSYEYTGAFNIVFYAYVTSKIAENYGSASYSWTPVSTDNVITAANGKVINIGYEVEADGKIDTNTTKISSDGAYYITTDGTSWNSPKYIANSTDAEKVRVRAIYYTTTEYRNTEFQRVKPDGNADLNEDGSPKAPATATKYQYDVVAVGEWSDYATAHNNASSALAVSAPASISVAVNPEDPYSVDVSWAKVERADQYRVDYIMSTVNMAVTKDNWDSGEFYTDEMKKDSKIAYTTKSTYTNKTKVTISGARKYPYMYFRVYVNSVQGSEGSGDEYYKDSTAIYYVTPTVIGTAAYAPQVTGLKVETKLDGTKQLTWDPVDTKVYFYAYESPTFPAYYYADILDANNGFAPVAEKDPDVEYIPSCRIDDVTVQNIKDGKKADGTSVYSAIYEEGTALYRVSNAYYIKPEDAETNTKTYLSEDAYYTTATDDATGVVFSGQVKKKIKDSYGVGLEAVMSNTDEGNAAIINRKVLKAEASAGASELNLSALGVRAGKKYYIVAHTYDTLDNKVAKADLVYNGYTFRLYNVVSPASAQVSATESIGAVSVFTSATKDTVKLSMYGAVTGYVIYKKSGKKYKKITTTTDNFYLDEGLKASTEYLYKVIPYYYDPISGENAKGDATFVSATTTATTNSLLLTAAKKKKNQVKLAWNKLAGATKYEIYRSDEYAGDPSVVAKKFSKNKNDETFLASYKFKLIKTIKKAKTTSLTDKSLIAGKTYSYVIVATYPMGKKTMMMTDSVSVSLKCGSPAVDVKVSGNKAKFSWLKDIYAKSYQLEYKLYDSQGNPTSVKPKKATTSKTSYTVAMPADGSVRLWIRPIATNGRVGNWSSYSADASLAAAKKVTAKLVTVTGTTRKGVKITWGAVAGASYYKVRRSTEKPVYSNDRKAYSSTGNYIAKESNDNEGAYEVSYDDYYHEADSIVGTSAIDASTDIYEGVKYYYTVEAYKMDGSIISVASYESAVAEINVGLSIAKPTLKAAKGKVTVSWKKVTGATGYTIYRSTKKGSGFVKIGTAKKSAKKYVDKTTKKGKKYYYKVAVNVTTKLKSTGTATSAVSKVVKAK